MPRTAADTPPYPTHADGNVSTSGSQTTSGDRDRASAVEALRCDCGRLLARVLQAAVELKCSRCKRVVILVEGRRYEQLGVGACDCLEALPEAQTLQAQRPVRGLRHPITKRPAISNPAPSKSAVLEAATSRRSNEVQHVDSRSPDMLARTRPSNG